MTKLTLAEALAYPERDVITLDEIDVSAEQVAHAVALFQQLVGLNSTSPAAWLHAAECDVREDGALFLALNDPATLANWFNEDDPAIYYLTEVTGGESWAAGLTERARALAWVQ